MGLYRESFIAHQGALLPFVHCAQTLSLWPCRMRLRVWRARYSSTGTASSAVASTGQLPGWLHVPPMFQWPAKLDRGISKVNTALATSSSTAPRDAPRANAHATAATNTA